MTFQLSKYLRFPRARSNGIALLVLLAAGCSDDPNDSTPRTKPFEGVTINMYAIGGGGYEALYTKIPEFESATGATVNMAATLTHFELKQLLVSKISGGNDADIDVFSAHGNYELDEHVYSLPLDTKFTAAEISDFYPSALDAGRFNGVLTMIPRHLDARLMYYRTDLFASQTERANFRAAYGYDLVPPTTFQQMKDVAQFFHRPSEGLYGFAAALKSTAMYITFFDFLLLSGGEMFDANAQPLFNGPEGVMALQQLSELYQFMPPDSIDYSWDEMAAAFREGRVAFSYDWPGWYTLLKDPNKSPVWDKFGMAALGTGPGGSKQNSGGVHGFAVYHKSSNPDAAVALVKFLTSAENLEFEAKEAGFLPASRRAFQGVKLAASTSSDPKDLARLELVEKSIENVRSLPQVVEVETVTSVIVPEMYKALRREQPAQTTLDAIRTAYLEAAR